MTDKKSGFTEAAELSFGIVRALASEVIALGGTEEDLRQILDDPRKRRRIASLLALPQAESIGIGQGTALVNLPTFRVKTDPDASLDALIKRGKYFWIHHEIEFNGSVQADFRGREIGETGGGGPYREAADPSGIDMGFVHLNEDMKLPELGALLETLDLRFGTLREMLAVGIQYPHFQAQFRIEAFGTSYRSRHDDRRYGFNLHMRDQEGALRALSIASEDGTLAAEHVRFLVAPK